MAVVSFPARNKLAYPAGSLPGFDPSHPAMGSFNGVISAVASGGNFINLANGVLGTLAGAVTSGFDGIMGPYVATASNKKVSFAAASFGTAINVTLAGIFSTAVTGANQTIAGWNQNSFMFLDTSNPPVLKSFNGSAAVVSSGLTVPVGAPHFAAACTNATHIRFVLTNLQTGAVKSATVASTNGTFTGTVLFIGADTSGAGSDDFTGSIAAAMMSFALLSEQQMVGWANDPWAAWYPPQAGSRVAATAVTPPTTVLYSLMNVG